MGSFFGKKKNKNRWAVVTFDQYANDFVNFGIRVAVDDYTTPISELQSVKSKLELQHVYDSPFGTWLGEQCNSYDALLYNYTSGGRNRSRPYSAHYMKDVNGAIVIVDAKNLPNHYSFSSISFYLKSIFLPFHDQEFNWRVVELVQPGIPVLICCTGTNQEHANTASEMMLHMKLNEFRQPWHFLEVNFESGFNVKEALDWLKNACHPEEALE